MTAISRWRTVVTAALALALVAGVGGAGTPAGGGTLRVGVGSDYTTLDPAHHTPPSEGAVLHQVLGTLVRMSSNAKMDALLMKARSTFAIAERKALYEQVQQLALDDSPMIFLVVMPTGQAMTARVRDFTHYPNMEIYLRSVWLDR